MASYPPPPPGYDWKMQRRMQRDQAQAQKAAMKAQRDLARFQARVQSRSSIVGPLLVLAVGVIALLVRLGRIPYVDFVSWYGRWWPLLLVIAGLVLVVEWLLDQRVAVDGTPIPRRGVGAGTVFLLVLGGLIGLGFQGYRDGRDTLVRTFSLDSDTLNQFLGEKHESSQILEAAFPMGTLLAIDNPHGDVTITGKSDDNKVHITCNKQVYSQSDSDASSKAEKLSPVVVLTGSTLRVTVAQVDGASADLIVTVPEFAETTVTSNHGDVAVSGIRAAVTVTANHGDVELTSIVGRVNAHVNRHDASFKAHQITGDLTLHGHAEDLKITDVSGVTTLDGEFYGDTHLEHLAGATSFHTTRTELSFKRLDGAFDISPDAELTGSEIAGPMVLRTRSRNITLNRVAGDVEVSNSDGSVDLTAVAPMGNVTVNNKNGEVNVTVPERAGFTVDAETQDGEIENDLSLTSTEDNHRTALRGTVGTGGAKVTIRTTHLNIGLHRGNQGPLVPPVIPVPPKAPEAPKAPAVLGKTTML
jgi:DUF4097 and DUF4098 domain-containing protein YvlB